MYVGSSVDLYRRFQEYYNIKYISMFEKICPVNYNTIVLCIIMTGILYTISVFIFNLNLDGICDLAMLVVPVAAYVNADTLKST